MSRTQVIVYQNSKILMVKHCEEKLEYWCLPGGSLEEGETAAQGALRELQEECNITGEIIRKVSETKFGEGDYHYTFWVEPDSLEISLGYDPELSAENQILKEVAWKSLDELSERDRIYLWMAGLLAVDDTLLNWKKSKSASL